jgi:hypothetical protein
MARHPQGIVFYLENGREKEARLVDDRMSISGDSYYWYQVDENLSRLKYFVVHHSVTKNDATPEDIAQMHLNRGWDGIGYHFVITRDGVIHYVGDLGTWRASVAGMNDCVIGVNLIGDFRFGNVPSDAQYKAVNALYREFVADSRFPGIKGPACVKFHRELQSTACPCDVNKDWVINGKPAPVVVTPAPVVVPPVVTPPIPTPPIEVTTPTTPVPAVTPDELKDYTPVDTSGQTGNKPVVLTPGPQLDLIGIWMRLQELWNAILSLLNKK